MGFTLPQPPPAPYDDGGGVFFLQIGNETVPLASFAGCFDKQIGVEYEDCYFETGLLADPLKAWVADTVTGAGPYRELAVFYADSTLVIRSRLDLGRAFIREFSLSDFDATDSSAGLLGLVVVPSTIQLVTSNPGSPDGNAGGISFSRSLFSFTLEPGGSANDVASVSGLLMSVPKLDQPPVGQRRVFSPGVPQFDALKIGVGAGDTLFDAWVGALGSGDTTPRTGTIVLLDASMRQIGSIRLDNLVPLAYPPYPTQPFGLRTFIASVGGIRFP